MTSAADQGINELEQELKEIKQNLAKNRALLKKELDNSCYMLKLKRYIGDGEHEPCYISIFKTTNDIKKDIHIFMDEFNRYSINSKGIECEEECEDGCKYCKKQYLDYLEERKKCECHKKCVEGTICKKFDHNGFYITINRIKFGANTKKGAGVWNPAREDLASEFKGNVREFYEWVGVPNLSLDDIADN